ncbi:MAG: hypothetical protein ACW986_01400 [Promethearchaeota archaeon]|jgi:hypothetical protein
MGEVEDIKEGIFWAKWMRQHWKVLAVVIAAGICIIVGAILVGIWFIETSPIGVQGTAFIGDFSLNWVVGFAILLFLWELLFVGVPTVLFFVIGGYLWWRRLPEEEKQEIKARDKKKHTKEKVGGSGGGGLLMFIAYCLYHGVMGNYYTPFGSLPYSFWIYSYLLTFAWMAITLGGPVLIILIIVYFAVWRKKKE